MLAVQALLRYEAADAALLPVYFPERLRKTATGLTGFDALRQRVRVTDRSGLDAFRRSARRDADDTDTSEPTSHEPVRSVPAELGAPDTVVWDERATDRFKRAVIVGDPGGGKTWLLRSVARQLAAAAADGIEARAPLAGIVLPLRVRLAEIADALAAPGAVLANVLVAEAEARATRQLKADAAADPERCRLIAPPPSFGPWVGDAIRSGRCVAMLDGWDEVTAREASIGPVLARFAADCPGARVLLTSRDADYDREQPPLGTVGEVHELELLALDRELVADFSRAWFDGAEPSDRQPVREALQGAFDRSPALLELARNPLMLTLMCRVMEEEPERFPTHRVEFYDRCVRGLLRDWKRERDAPALQVSDAYVDGVIDLVARVALQLSLDGAVQCTASRLSSIVEACQAQLGPGHPLAPTRMDWAAVVRTLMADGILVPLGGFSRADVLYLHRTFQQYLTGVALVTPALDAVAVDGHQPSAAARASQIAQLLASRMPEWHEETVLALGYVGLVQTKVPGRTGLVAEVIELVLASAPAERRNEALALMGRAVAELGKDGVGEDCHKRISGRLRDALRGTGILAPAPARLARLVGALVWRSLGGSVKTEAQQRVAFGNVLARIGDFRFHDEDRWCLPNDVACGFASSAQNAQLGFVRIPAGTVLMGEDEKQHPVSVGGFLIARWPVTVAQFRAFVKAVSYTKAGTHWERGLSNHPVVHVSWRDAQEYCRWLSEQFERYSERLPPVLRQLVTEEGWRVALPSEAEWERAACGDSGRIYPWGNERPDPDRANYVATGVDSTSAVGCFPRGATPAKEGGIEELAGNVWEWTRSAYDGRDGREHLDRDRVRVVRGGAFYSSPGYVRAACRVRNFPDPRGGSLGFRLAVSPFRSFSDPLDSDSSGL